MSIPKVKRYENGKEITGQVDTPYEITWEAWQLLTDAEKEKRKWLITDVPGAKGFITVENMKLLWSNPSPTSAFTAQNITLASSDYDKLLVIARNATSINRAISVCADKGMGFALSICGPGAGNAATVVIRPVEYVNDTTFTIYNCSSAVGTTSTTDNSQLIPIAIYGIKQQTEIRFNALAENVKATVDYSTDEQPIGTWIDGRTLYQKTLNLGAMPNNTAKNVVHGISNLDFIIDYRGFVKHTTVARNGLPIPFVNTNGTNATSNIRVSLNGDNLVVMTPSDFSSYEGYVTLQYVKTT